MPSKNDKCLKCLQYYYSTYSLLPKLKITIISSFSTKNVDKIELKLLEENHKIDLQLGNRLYSKRLNEL